ncbi:MAG: porin [Flavitalea sp.]
MKIRVSFKIVFLLFIAAFYLSSATAQFLVEMIDTSTNANKGLWALYKTSDRLQISGYFQPQFQVAGSKGAKNFSGGDFSKYSDSRFMIRRGRLRFDYAHFTDKGLPQVQLVFQFDGSEKGVAIRDFWGRFYENKFQLFSFTAGMFARPFGYEVNLGSSDRETPERGRMSQTLMKTERDLGFMATFEPRKSTSKVKLLKIDVGVFNGQGLTGTEEYDSYKDIIGRISLKPFHLSPLVTLTAGTSFFEGGIVQNTKYLYHESGKTFTLDSSLTNIGRKAPRKYHGVDAQLKIKNPFGKTEIRGEYWWGTQSASANESLTPGTVLNEPYYIRTFTGAFIYLLQNIVNDHNQIGIKYDFYDPNTKASASEIGAANSNTHSGDVKFNTLGFGYIYTFDVHTKLQLWYEVVNNEHTLLDGYKNDVKDNIFTCRIQFRF